MTDSEVVARAEKLVDSCDEMEIDTRALWESDEIGDGVRETSGDLDDDLEICVERDNESSALEVFDSREEPDVETLPVVVRDLRGDTDAEPLEEAERDGTTVADCEMLILADAESLLSMLDDWL